MKKIFGNTKKTNQTNWKLTAYTKVKGQCKGRSKAPRSGYHLFLREQLDKMTGHCVKWVEGDQGMADGDKD